LVFGIVFRFDSINYPPQVIVQSDVDQLPGLWSLHHFDVVDERIPGNWAFNEFKYFGVVENYYQICPHEFLGEFWNLFNDANKDAESIFFAVKELIRRFHDFGG